MTAFERGQVVRIIRPQTPLPGNALAYNFAEQIGIVVESHEFISSPGKGFVRLNIKDKPDTTVTIEWEYCEVVDPSQPLRSEAK